MSDIVVRKYAPAYYSRASTVTREWYLSGHRFVYLAPASPTTPVSGGLPTLGLIPSGWPRNRLTYNSSPGYGSSSSSECGDEPLTPITPVHSHIADPFSAVAKENIAPVHLAQLKQTSGKGVGQSAAASHGHIRPALHVINPMVDHAVPGRNMRRLSN